MRLNVCIVLIIGILTIPYYSFCEEANEQETSSLSSKITILPLLTIYQKHLSAFTTKRCPSWPHCSHYSRQAIMKHGTAIGIMMTVDRLIHEAGEIQQGKKIFIRGKGYLIDDPLENNSFWWKSREGKYAIPDIPQMSIP